MTGRAHTEHRSRFSGRVRCRVAEPCGPARAQGDDVGPTLRSFHPHRLCPPSPFTPHPGAASAHQGRRLAFGVWGLATSLTRPSIPFYVCVLGWTHGLLHARQALPGSHLQPNFTQVARPRVASGYGAGRWALGLAGPRGFTPSPGGFPAGGTQSRLRASSWLGSQHLGHACSLTAGCARPPLRPVLPVSLGPRSTRGLTVEPGLGGDAAADAEAVLPVADVECRHGWVVGHLRAEAALEVALGVAPGQPRAPPGEWGPSCRA